ncbi:MAG: SIMPL domain-containing protein [Nitrososphaera sp.]
MSRKKETTFAVLTGILALGIFAAAYSSTQMLNAVAQTSEEQARQQYGISVDEALPISAPYYHGYSGTPTVSTSGFATTDVQPDKFSVTVGVETDGITAQEAADKNADLMEKVVAALRALGISEDQISTSNYSVYPVYSVIKDVNSCRVMEGYPIPPECYSDQTITGYKAVNSVTVTLDVDGDIDAGKVIDAAIGAGANNVNGVFFFISQEMQQVIRDSLIKEAIASARQRAEIAADAVGMEITGVQAINLNDVYFPIFSRGAFDATVAETPFFPGEQEITNTVNVVFTMGNGTPAGEVNSTGFGQREAAVAFLEERLPQLGFVIDDPMDRHMDLITHVSETEYHADFAVIDTNGQVHNGHVEVVEGEVAVAELDGESIL